jgi:hypothetical protein
MFPKILEPGKANMSEIMNSRCSESEKALI